jgi:hypothetical protein
MGRNRQGIRNIGKKVNQPFRIVDGGIEDVASRIDTCRKPGIIRTRYGTTRLGVKRSQRKIQLFAMPGKKLKKLIAIDGDLLILFAALSGFAQSPDFFEVAKNGTPRDVLRAVEKGANASRKDKSEKTALDYAKAAKNSSAITLLTK